MYISLNVVGNGNEPAFVSWFVLPRHNTALRSSSWDGGTGVVANTTLAANVHNGSTLFCKVQAQVTSVMPRSGSSTNAVFPSHAQYPRTHVHNVHPENG